MMKLCLASLFALGVLSGCARSVLVADENRFVIDNRPDLAADDAAKHCAQYGKKAVYQKTEPYRYNQTITTFSCE